MRKIPGLCLWIFQVTPLLLFGLLYGMRVCRCAQMQREQQRPFGRYTSEQIIEHSFPLLAALELPENTLQFSASHLAVYAHGERRRSLWEVDCLNPSGNFRAILLWDADTGELMKIGRHVLSAPYARPLTRSERLKAAQRWFHILVPNASYSETPTLVEDDDASDAQQFTWCLHGERETLLLDARGELVIFHRYV